MAWKTLSSTTLFERAPYLKVRQETIELRPGEVIDDFYQVDLRPFVLVVPVLEDGRFQLIEQYKHGPRREVLGFPAGYIDPGEPPEQAARRELLEETGLKPARLVPLGSYVDNGNQKGCTGHYFAALECCQVQAPDPGDLEDFHYLTLSDKEVDAALAHGRFGIIHHVAGWGLYQSFLRQEALSQFPFDPDTL